MPIFGAEGLISGHDTIFFAVERGMFKQFRPILQVGRERADHYRRIKELMPPGSIMAVRHFDSAASCYENVRPPRPANAGAGHLAGCGPAWVGRNIKIPAARAGCFLLKKRRLEFS